jgi:hypothetical protein
VDAEEGDVVARLNRGGIIDEVEFSLNPQSPLQRVQDGNTSDQEQ